MPDNVCCAECGLLALQRVNGTELVAVDNELRKSWHHAPKAGQFRPAPICACNAMPLHDEWKPESKAKASEEFLRVISKPRKCESFLTWMPAFSLEKHTELNLIEQRLAEDRKWREEADRRADLRHRWNIAAIIGAALIGSIIGYMATANRPPVIVLPSPPAEKAEP